VAIQKINGKVQHQSMPYCLSPISRKTAQFIALMTAKLHKLLPGLNHTLLTVEEGMKTGRRKDYENRDKGPGVLAVQGMILRWNSACTSHAHLPELYCPGHSRLRDCFIHKLHPQNENNASLRALQELLL
jgi:hypothetical protein